MKVWRATFQYTRAGQTCDLGLHYQWDGDTGSAELSAAAAASALDGELRAALRQMLGGSDSLVELKVTEELDPSLPSAAPEVAVIVINQGGTGIDAAGTQANEIVPLFHRKTAGGVRGAQSWTFGPSPRGGAPIVGGHWDTGSLVYGWWDAFVGHLDNALHITDVLNPTNPNGWLRPVAYAKTRRRRGLTPYTFDVTGAAVDPRPRWLRSRA